LESVGGILAMYFFSGEWGSEITDYFILLSDLCVILAFVIIVTSIFLGSSKYPIFLSKNVSLKLGSALLTFLFAMLVVFFLKNISLLFIFNLLMIMFYTAVFFTIGAVVRNIWCAYPEDLIDTENTEPKPE
jgi:uncharacterized membrane protein